MTALIKKKATGGAGDGEKLIFEKEAGEAISALKMLFLTDTDTVELADKASYQEAKSIGIALTAVAIGANVKIIQFGEVIDAFFSFTLNEPLFLGSNGSITNIPPTSGFSTTIGHGLGIGGIYIDIQEPIELTI